MIKKLFAAAGAILVVVSAVFAVYAHPGRTDSNGGHTVKDTGEYHYHHGYPAHEHRDMDNDGSLDCPYDFDDKTGQDSVPVTKKPDKATQVTKRDNKPNYIAVGVVSVILLAIWLLPAFIKKK